MTRHRNQRHELFARALAEGKSRTDAMVAAGYSPHRGNKNRLAQHPDIVARVEEIRKHSEEIVDLRKIDRGRLLIELARIACADVPLRAAAIAREGPEALDPDQPVLLVSIRMEGIIAKPIEMRLLDDRGVLTSLMRYDGAPDRSPKADLSPSIPPDCNVLEQALRELLAQRDDNPNQQGHDDNDRHPTRPCHVADRTSP